MHKGVRRVAPTKQNPCGNESYDRGFLLQARAFIGGVTQIVTFRRVLDVSSCGRLLYACCGGRCGSRFIDLGMVSAGAVWPVGLSAFGDLFLNDADGSIKMLDLVACDLKEIATCIEEFDWGLGDPTHQEEWLMVGLCRRNGNRNSPAQTSALLSECLRLLAVFWSPRTSWPGTDGPIRRPCEVASSSSESAARNPCRN